MGIRTNFCMERVVMHGNGLPRDMLESPSLEVFKRCADVAPRGMV